MNIYLAIVKKEILDAIRDGKSLATALLLPIILAFVSFGTLHFLVSVQASTQTITLPVRGAEYISPLISHLKEKGITIVEAPENAEQTIRSQEFDMVLVITEKTLQRFRQQQTVDVHLLSDHSRSETQAKVSHIKSLISQWSFHTGALRLIARNVNPGIASPLNIVDVNVTSPERSASKILAGLPMFILLIAFGSGIGMISDMASGERERKSLEPLLINPIPQRVVFTGKWLAATVVTLVFTVFGVALQFFSINASPIAELGLRVEMGFDKFFIILLIILPVIFFAVALQLFISFFARSFKDAQSYNSLVVMLPMVPGLYLTFNSGSAETWQMLVPLLGPTALFVDIVGGDGASFFHAALCSMTSLVCAVLCLIAGISLLKSERTIFG